MLPFPTESTPTRPITCRRSVLLLLCGLRGVIGAMDHRRYGMCNRRKHPAAFRVLKSGSGSGCVGRNDCQSLHRPSWVADILTDWQKIGEFADEAHNRMVHYLTSNPIMGSQFDTSDDHGYSEFMHERLTRQLGHLVHSPPATPAWASCIFRLPQN
jgi:hypothetical protein